MDAEKLLNIASAECGWGIDTMLKVAIIYANCTNQGLFERFIVRVVQEEFKSGGDPHVSCDEVRIILGLD